VGVKPLTDGLVCWCGVSQVAGWASGCCCYVAGVYSDKAKAIKAVKAGNRKPPGMADAFYKMALTVDGPAGVFDDEEEEN
jgi:hypothetical protein